MSYQFCVFFLCIYPLQTGNILQDGQGAARENETEKQHDSRSKSSQHETSRGSSKLVGMSKRSGTKGEVSFHIETIKFHPNIVDN